MFRIAAQLISRIKRTLKSTDPEDCFQLQFSMLRLSGMYHDPSKGRYLTIFSVVPSFLIFLLSATSGMFLFSDNVPFKDKLEGLFAYITSSLCVIKIYYLRKNQDRLAYLVARLKSLVDCVNEDELKMMNKEAVFPTGVLYLIFQITGLVTCGVLYGLFPVGSSNYGRPLPYYAWSPSYFKEGIPYVCFYAVHLLGLLCCPIPWMCGDTINFGLLSIHNVMLKILTDRVTRLGWSKKCSGKDYHNDNYNKLCEHVEYHLRILSYGKETKLIYGEHLYVKICMSVLIICTFMYKIGFISITHDFGKFITQMYILYIIISTLFSLSWISAQICATSDNLIQKAGECNFQSMDRKTTKSLLLFMEGVYPSVYIEVGSIIQLTLSLKMFVNVMDFAYKCVALLKSTSTTRTVGHELNN